jgi:hypothetical protein
VDNRVDPYDPTIRRRNVRLFFILLAAIVGVALVPAVYRTVQQPTVRYDTMEEARAGGAVEDGTLPGFLPPEATDIRARHHRTAGWRIVRFGYPPDAAERFTRGMRRLEQDEVERVTVPTVGWVPWWLISSRTLQGRQGEFLNVYEVPPPDAGYLAVDPRTRTGYHWTRRER